MPRSVIFRRAVRATSRRRVRRPLRMVTTFLVLLWMTGCTAVVPPRVVKTEHRLEIFPQDELPLEEDVSIYWNKQQVPFIEAQTDRDLAFTLGMVHGHLRSGQIAFLKRISQGRISEMAGPFTTEIDKALRTLDFGYAAAEIVQKMDPETKAWMQAFVEGLNYYHERVKPLPHEWALLGVQYEPYTLEDLVTIGRLAGTDVNWLVYFSLLKERTGENWEEIWEQTLKVGTSSLPSFEADQDRLAQLGNLLQGLSRSGSNSIVVGPQKTNGPAMIANDPHLGISIPNFWVLAGYKSPSYHVVGMMVPGLPFAGLGRNPDLAWGGTNMRSASSDLYDVSQLPREQIQSTEETLQVRWWLDETFTVRRTPYGPILSDVDLIPKREGEELALRWVGHSATDEISAFLAANRAKTPAEFRAAFETYGVSGQNMLFADKAGNIGMVLAVELPKRQYAAPSALVLDPSNPQHAWQGTLRSTELPWQLNPEAGFIASANNLPVESDPPINYFFGQSERIERLQHLLTKAEFIDMEWLRQVQQDVYSPSSHRLAQRWVQMIQQLELSSAQPQVFAALQAWNGEYNVEQQGPVVFELLTHYLREGLFAEQPSKRDSGSYQRWNYVSQFMAEDIAQLTDAEQRLLFMNALEQTETQRPQFPNWGAMHRLPIKHVLGNLPLVGGNFRFDDLPAAGSRETVMKTDHSLGNAMNSTGYGSQSRHISIMNDPDENYFVLLGGQDGWLGSQNMTDQVRLWQRGDYLRLPLRMETVRREFPVQMSLKKR